MLEWLLGRRKTEAKEVDCLVKKQPKRRPMSLYRLEQVEGRNETIKEVVEYLDTTLMNNERRQIKWFEIEFNSPDLQKGDTFLLETHDYFVIKGRVVEVNDGKVKATSIGVPHKREKTNG